MNNKEQRANEFINCLGNGKSIYQCESENDSIDEEFKILVDGKPKQGMSSTAVMINQVFDEELAKITDKNITDICKKQQPKGL